MSVFIPLYQSLLFVPGAAERAVAVLPAVRVVDAPAIGPTAAVSSPSSFVLRTYSRTVPVSDSVTLPLPATMFALDCDWMVKLPLAVQLVYPESDRAAATSPRPPGARAV